MEYKTTNTIDKRIKRMDDVCNLVEPDRVPWAPRMGMIYAQAAGVSMYEAYMDLRNMKPGIVNLFSKYESDLYWSPAGYPANIMEVTGAKHVSWPGATCGLPLNMGHQIVDGEYMLQDEYDELINNPSHFFLTKIFPRRHKKLAGLAKVDTFRNVIELGHYATMSAFADPEVREAFLTLMAAGDESVKWLVAQQELAETAISMHVPPGVMAGLNAPYDMLADTLRGYLEVPMDCFEMPEKVLAAIEVLQYLAFENIRQMKAMGQKYVFMPLHGGIDELMSDENYRKFYWPS